MIDVGKVIQKLRTEKGWNKSELAKRIHVSPQTVINYETGFRRPDFDTLEVLAEVFNCPISYFLTTEEERDSMEVMQRARENRPLPEGVKRISEMTPYYIPIVRGVSAGVPLYMEENYGVYVDSPRKADFAVTIEGDAMSPLYLDGDVVYVSQVQNVSDGEVCAAAVDGKCGLYRIYHLALTYN